MSVGPLTIERHRALCAEGVHLHVFVDGIDVTARCKFADDTPRAQSALLYKLDADGKKYFDYHKREIATEWVFGNRVEIREGEPFTAASELEQ